MSTSPWRISSNSEPSPKKLCSVFPSTVTPFNLKTRTTRDWLRPPNRSPSKASTRAPTASWATMKSASTWRTRTTAGQSFSANTIKLPTCSEKNIGSATTTRGPSEGRPSSLMISVWPESWFGRSIRTISPETVSVSSSPCSEPSTTRSTGRSTDYRTNPPEQFHLRFRSSSFWQLSFLHCAIINLKFVWLFSWLREFFLSFLCDSNCNCFKIIRRKLCFHENNNK